MIIILILLAILGFCVFMILRNHKKNKYWEKLGAIFSFYTNHVSGFSHFAEGERCEIVAFPDKVLFINEGNFSTCILKSEIMSMSVRTDKDIQKQYVSSVGGAFAGGLLFGAIGAIIGGRAKQKKIKTVSRYLTITYKEKSKDNPEGEVKILCFEADKCLLSAWKLTKHYKEKRTCFAK